MMVVGVLGGSFDPVHLGHQALVEAVLASGLVERLIIVPAWLSPHKMRTGASAHHRLAMVELAFAGRPQVRVDPREALAGRMEFAVDTLAALQGEMPTAALRLIIGADNLPTLPTWHRPQRLVELAEIIVAGRGGAPCGPDGVLATGLPPDRFHFLPDFDHPASSSAVRRHLAAGDLPGDLLPYPVIGYIRANGLYSFQEEAR